MRVPLLWCRAEGPRSRLKVCDPGERRSRFVGSFPLRELPISGGIQLVGSPLRSTPPSSRWALPAACSSGGCKNGKNIWDALFEVRFSGRGPRGVSGGNGADGAPRVGGLIMQSTSGGARGLLGGALTKSWFPTGRGSHARVAPRVSLDARGRKI